MRQDNGSNSTQSTLKAPVGRVSQKGTTLGTDGGQNLLYAMCSHKDQESSSDIVTGRLKVFSIDTYALYDSGANLSFAKPYIDVKFEIDQEQLLEPSNISTPIGESVLAKSVYRNCTI